MRIVWIISFLVVGVLLYVALGGFPQPTVVTMTQTGYSPSELTIDVGTTVVFTNGGEVDFWPAVDEHPTHTLYDGTTVEEHCVDGAAGVFDACRSVLPGESWTFTFNDIGTFPFHDHFWPHLTGTITVVDGAGETKSVVQALDPYVAQAIAADPQVAIAALERDAASSSELYARCHEILHDIGKRAFTQYGSFEAASVFQDDFCNSGYIHGVFEAYFANVADPLVGLTETCKQYGAVALRPFDTWQCRHGIGHGFMYFTGGDVTESLTLCTETFKEENDAKDCINGVYMEVFNSEVLAKEHLFVNPEDPFATCAMHDIGKGDCYNYLPTYLSQTKGIAFADMYDLCDEAPLSYKKSCQYGISAEAMKRNMGSPHAVFTLCNQQTGSRRRVSCIVSAINMYINQTGSLEDAAKLCEAKPMVFQTICNNTIEFRKPDFAVPSE